MRPTINKSILETVGWTPLVELHDVPRGLGRTILVKVEASNPSGSIKIRSALPRIQEAIRNGELREGQTILEASSGNQGISIACISARLGYKSTIIMPSTMSEERICIMLLYGASVITRKADGTDIKTTGEAKAYAEELAKSDSSYFYMKQFDVAPTDTSMNAAHEIIQQMGDTVLDGFVAANGTGYTLSSCSRILKSAFPSLRVGTVKTESFPHGQQGIGVDFIPNILDVNSYDDTITVSDKDAVETAKKLAAREGLLCGISSGSNVWAAIEFAKTLPEGSTVATICPDSAERYLSLFCSKIDVA
jgi:cysteine synthase A